MGFRHSTITRLKEVWGIEADRQRNDLTAKRWSYFWVGGFYWQPPA